MITEPKPSLRDRLRYRFDGTISKGAVAVVGWLAVATFAAILIAAAVLALFVRIDGAKPSFIEGFWISLLRTLDPGTMGGDLGWGFRITSLLVTFTGLFIVATLIGLISSGIDQKLESIRKGRTEVLERGHTLILGWSPKIFTIISELVIANDSESKSSIVVMTPRDKIEMEDEIRERIGATKTKIVCRTGDPASPADLALVHPLRAKSIIVLSPEEDSPDARVVKTVLALGRIDPEFTSLQVVAELSDARHERAVLAATRGRVTTVVSEDVIARITAQVCRTAGLSAVYQDLLDFDGDEIYFFDDDRLTGTTFAEALLAFEKSAVLGIRCSDGTVRLNPDMATRFAPGDGVVVVAEDDSAIRWQPITLSADVARPNANAVPVVAERTLIVGWNGLGERVVQQLDRCVSPGSSVFVAFDAGTTVSANASVLTNISMDSAQIDTNDEDELASLFDTADFDHVMILCSTDGTDSDAAGARALLTLVQIREILSTRTDRPAPSIVTELLDVRDVELARAANPDDYVVSLSLTSLMLAQLSENPTLAGVFDDLFDPEGTELSLVPVEAYLDAGSSARFAEAVSLASVNGCVALGYRHGPREGQPARVVMNPAKSEVVTFAPGDQLIVLR